MKITRVCCQGCGADLEVDENVRYVTCNYCHARLEVVHDTSVTHTRLLEKLEQNTERMAGNLQVIELQNDLERLDREWELERGNYMFRGKSGKLYPPTRQKGGVIFVVLFAVGWMILTAQIGAPMPFPLFGLFFIGVVIHGTVKAGKRADEYEFADRKFQLRRGDLIRQIEAARGSREAINHSPEYFD